MAFDLASFKNSRDYPRKATTSSSTVISTVVGNGAPNATKILDVDGNRTYSTLRNMNGTKDFPAGVDAMKYMYRHAGDAVPTVVQILANGFILDPKEAFDLESPEELYGVSTTVNAVPYNLDRGVG